MFNQPPKNMNLYESLPKLFYDFVAPTPVLNPHFSLINDDLLNQLKLNMTNEAFLNLCSGNKLPENFSPLAQAYAGHQFGHFNILGDGRAILLGQMVDENNNVLNLQLKGSGPTLYSRRGDGRGTLSSMLREYLLSEAMFSLNIPTTRSLAVVDSGEMVRRQNFEPGGILTRLSQSFVRVGTFEFAAAKGIENVKALADYMIKHHFKSLDEHLNPYEAMFEAIVKKQSELLALWQSVGFIHGVMNTDNMSIVGETIDYGPCAFMDTYHPKTVFSAIDTNGRYAYNNQPNMALWNLTRLAETLIFLFDGNQETQVKTANKLLGAFKPLYNTLYYERMSKKLGLSHSTYEDQQLIESLFDIMYSEKLDYTNTLSMLSYDLSLLPRALEQWLEKWQLRVKEHVTISQAQKNMQALNPWIIPRNHLVEKALEEGIQGDLEFFKAFSSALSKPFDYTTLNPTFTQLPRPHERVIHTYCNT